MNDEDLGKRLKTDLKKRGMEEFEMKRYRSQDDIRIYDMQIDIDDLY